MDYDLIKYTLYIFGEGFNLRWMIESIFIMGGLWVVSKLLWMNIYQFKYGGNAGNDYFHYGKKYVITHYKKINWWLEWKKRYEP